MNQSAILKHFNITELNEMQKAMLDAVAIHNDLILISPTGSGKTLGFLLPLVKLLNEDIDGVQALIIVPSRELAIQIEQVFKQMKTVYKINCCYGGHSVRIEENNLLEAPAVLVGTPGRIAHHLRKRTLSLKSTSVLILDEFDKSLEFGFQDEMDFIIQQGPYLKKRILTSATEIDEVPDFVGLKKPERIKFTKQSNEQESLLQLKYVRVEGDDKLEGLMLLLGKLNSKPTIVFCNHRDAVNRISMQLDDYKIDHSIYHGALEQIDREKSLIKLRNGSVTLLISTDLASRGLDIPEIEYVIHYQLPTTKDALIHRNGRTARMKANGTVYFLLDADDYLPDFLDEKPEEDVLPQKLILPKQSTWKTLFIGAGKKDKVNKMDIVGMLIQKGKLQKEDLGKIEVLDKSAFVAVNSSKIQSVLKLIKEEKIKGQKVKFALST